MRRKIFVSHMVMIFLLSISFVFIIKGSLTETVESRYEIQLANDLKMARALFLENPSRSVQSFADYLKEELHVRVTVIDFEGVVIADTDATASEMDNHRLREEFVTAVTQNTTAISIRHSDTLGMDYMYAALPIADHFILRISLPLTAIEAINKQIFNYALILICLALGVSGLIAFLISKRITEPIDVLTKATEDIAKGNYGKKVYGAPKDQIGQLTEAFNVMSLNLREIMSELNTRKSELESILNSMINGVLAVDTQYQIMLINPMCFNLLGLSADYVSEGDTMYKIIRNEEVIELVEAAIKDGKMDIKEIAYPSLERILRIRMNPIKGINGSIEGCIIVLEDVTQIRKLEQMRTDFVSNVSHELKTPLTSIKGFVETLKNGAVHTPETAMRFLDIIDIESDRLYRLINDILTLSDIEQMKSDRDLSEVHLKNVVQEVVEMLKISASEKALALNYSVGEDITLYANRDRIKQMLINLVDNGIKYTEKGSVTIDVKTTANGVHIQVADTGVGFEEVHKERLFERFYRVDKGRSRNKGGTGLGLSIVKHIVLLYGGQIYVESQPNKGTTFDIYFKEA